MHFIFSYIFINAKKPSLLFKGIFHLKKKPSNDLDELAEFKSSIFRNKINLNTILFVLIKYFIQRHF